MEGMNEKLVELKKVLRECLHFNYDEFSGDMSIDIELTAENLIDHGVTMQQWVPVKDMLPDDGTRVLVYFDDGVVRFGISRGGIANVVSQKYLSRNHKTVFSKATHWMPLPEPPKEVNNDA